MSQIVLGKDVAVKVGYKYTDGARHITSMVSYIDKEKYKELPIEGVKLKSTIGDYKEILPNDIYEALMGAA